MKMENGKSYKKTATPDFFRNLYKNYILYFFHFHFPPYFFAIITIFIIFSPFSVIFMIQILLLLVALAPIY